MKIHLAYGKTGLRVNLPDDARVTIVEPKFVSASPDPIEAVRTALRHPIGAPPLKEWIKPLDRVGIVFSDLTRPTPNHILLPVLCEELVHLPDAQIILFNSTGTHRPNTDQELRGMLGDEIVNRYHIVQNNANDRASHIRVGATQGGNDIWLHREFVECDAHILTGFIEPHFFAGFSGAGKATMPGLALLETILRNHKPQFLDHPQTRWGVTHGNPLWEEVHEAATMVPRNFLLNVTLNRDKQITRVFAGDLDAAHAQGCEFVRQTAMIGMPERFDIVIGCNSGYPLDLNLYQSVKGMSAAAQLVKKSGSIIIAAECWDGIPDHGEYARLLREAQDLPSLLQTVRAPGFLVQDMWEAQMQALIQLQADVYFYSHNLTDEQMRMAHLNACRSIEATIEMLRSKYGHDASICVLPEGPQTIPYIQN
jgi:lactate racemase